MDSLTKGFLRRITANRGPVETQCLLKEAFAEALQFGALSRVGKRRLFAILQDKFPPPVGDRRKT